MHLHELPGKCSFVLWPEARLGELVPIATDSGSIRAYSEASGPIKCVEQKWIQLKSFFASA